MDTVSFYIVFGLMIEICYIKLLTHHERDIYICIYNLKHPMFYRSHGSFACKVLVFLIPIPSVVTKPVEHDVFPIKATIQ